MTFYLVVAAGLAWLARSCWRTNRVVAWGFIFFMAVSAYTAFDAALHPWKFRYVETYDEPSYRGR